MWRTSSPISFEAVRFVRVPMSEPTSGKRAVADPEFVILEQLVTWHMALERIENPYYYEISFERVEKGIEEGERYGCPFSVNPDRCTSCTHRPSAERHRREGGVRVPPWGKRRSRCTTHAYTLWRCSHSYYLRSLVVWVLFITGIPLPGLGTVGKRDGC